MTVAEQRFLEGVPRSLKRIEENTARIASALERLVKGELIVSDNNITNNNQKSEQQ